MIFFLRIENTQDKMGPAIFRIQANHLLKMQDCLP